VEHLYTAILKSRNDLVMPDLWDWILLSRVLGLSARVARAIIIIPERGTWLKSLKFSREAESKALCRGNRRFLAEASVMS
jgi:hypothetical protein